MDWILTTCNKSQERKYYEIVIRKYYETATPWLHAASPYGQFT